MYLVISSKFPSCSWSIRHCSEDRKELNWTLDQGHPSAWRVCVAHWVKWRRRFIPWRPKGMNPLQRQSQTEMWLSPSGAMQWDINKCIPNCTHLLSKPLLFVLSMHSPYSHLTSVSGPKESDVRVFFLLCPYNQIWHLYNFQPNWLTLIDFLNAGTLLACRVREIIKKRSEKVLWTHNPEA